ncbi:stimulator of interferon genes protein isoform X2 [Erpetoichthys calabaricus]|uniref:Stimulator of interferon genes protein n=2 Tax=Erpetoichthys calabaricus TaxID=27687 RepID=A0A8C4SD95_ERPCA|nr:stimulator of interferon genes protein isoform X2 [Erpetoichthys calabaricus]XP_028669297.1 stimulator of interferon genes protein isoform X2 [Erpetoichthys calabaricus]XP_051789331.1 stimulator of interferon genes protein isoform X2 [Erpetoichthys calabaricus]XP_051789332.1 stimulator of interferon genes protein isoform X2 [Erpetoichthys calabaricus]XP_051789333.1 stimulator of interferon genes protein isoform X2 [Erpetoichthys calabaricus]XP_051789334.1 stimulator of interferon genes prot
MSCHLSDSDNPNIVPKPRGNSPKVIATTLAILFILYIYIYQEEHDVIHMLKNSFFISFSSYMLKGICNFVEERWHHFQPRYGKNCCKLLKACFFEKTVFCIFVAVFIVLFTSFKLQDIVQIILGCCCFLIFYVAGFFGPTEVEISQICEMNKKNVAHGLAWSFYIGYLKKVLPRLENLIEAYHAEKDNSILRYKDTWKVHILIPLDCHIPDEISKEDANIHFFDNLPDTQLNVAGVMKRSYKHSVYEIFDESKRPHFCIVEYATPLVSLYEMSRDSQAAFSSQDRLEQTKLFYRTLKDILEDSKECRNLYRLVLLNDNKRGEDPHYLSKEIIKHLDQQITEEYSVEEEGQQLQHNFPTELSHVPKLMISNDNNSDLPRSLIA